MEVLTYIRGIHDGARHRRALYRCECGREVIAIENNVRIGHTTSCGCLRRKAVSMRSLTHGHRIERTKTYVAWLNMKARCNNKNRRDYVNYGGRGIGYDARWESFENFLADMGQAPKQLTLDRIDNALGYSKGNCRWAPRSVQALNKRNNVIYAVNGVSRTLSEWSRINGIGRVTMLKRLQRGVPVELALTVKGFLRT